MKITYNNNSLPKVRTQIKLNKDKVELIAQIRRHRSRYKGEL